MSSLAIGLIVGAVILAVTEIVVFYPKKQISKKAEEPTVLNTEKREERREIIKDIYGYYMTEGNETLETVAKKLYGCRECWLSIYELNKSKVKKNPWKTLPEGIRLKYKKELTYQERENLKREYMSWLKRISTGKYLPE